MKITELESCVIARMLADRELMLARTTVNFDAVSVSARENSGAGFLTEFSRSEELKVFDTDVSLRWGKVGARLNSFKVETGYLVYVDHGYITGVEGYTYGDEWPDKIEQIELYELKSGMELVVPPRGER